MLESPEGLQCSGSKRIRQYPAAGLDFAEHCLTESVICYDCFISYALNSVFEYSLGEMRYFCVKALEK